MGRADRATRIKGRRFLVVTCCLLIIGLTRRTVMAMHLAQEVTDGSRASLEVSARTESPSEYKADIDQVSGSSTRRNPSPEVREPSHDYLASDPLTGYNPWDALACPPAAMLFDRPEIAAETLFGYSFENTAPEVRKPSYDYFDHNPLICYNSWNTFGQW